MLNISPKFVPNDTDAEFVDELVKREKSPEAMKYFMANCHILSNYCYWFFLSTLWVSYSGWIDLDIWRKAFSSPRGDRRLSIMKPDELEAFDRLPQQLTVWRAHREGEADFISFTLNPNIAANMAVSRDVDVIRKYKINKKFCICLFLRRGEHEIITMESHQARWVSDTAVVLVKDLEG